MNTSIILIHGLGGTPTEMKYVGGVLEKRGIRVEYCTLKGHCSTIDDLRNSTYKEWIESVNICYDNVKKHSDKVFVSGLSAGCLLALHLAVNKTVDGVILYSPTFVLNGWSMPFYMPYLRYMKPWMDIFKLNLKERHPYGLKDERIRNMVTSQMDSGDPTKAGSFYTPLQTMIQFNMLSLEVEKNIHNVDSPILSFHSTEDDVASISNSYKLMEACGDVELVELNDSYHLVTLDKQRMEVCEKTLAFINERSNNEV